MAALTDITAPLEQEGTRSVVRKWLAKVGDRLAVNDPVVELETDKVSVEVAAEVEGVLAEIVLDSGADAEPGAVLGRLSTDGQGPARDENAEPDLEMALPRDGQPSPLPLDGGEAGREGVAKTASGLEEERQSPLRDSPSTVLATHPSPALPQSRGKGASIASFDPALRLSPSVRRRLIETSLDPRALTGSGRGGRITRADVDEATARGVRPQPATDAVTAAPHDSMRLRIAEHMVQSLSAAPHVTAVFEADFSAITTHRRAHKAAFAAKGVNLTFTAYIVAAACEAMKAAPAVNARWFEDRLEIYGDINVGVGTALGDKGLVVPVIRQAQTLDLFGLAERLHDLTERARANRLTPKDVQGGTFSISNHGVSGSLIAAPIIINQPQSAILGVGKLEKRVVVREVDGADAILIRPMAYVSLSIDHRVLDGHQTNAWLTRFVEVLEGWPAK
jgi:2-oxoglutarate dehydrogenase E2 component (dihydrolipoamide succinyltransferase)